MNTNLESPAQPATTAAAPVPPPPVRPHLSVWDTVSIIIGIVIGAGIYETAPFIFKNVSGPWSALGVWALGGVLSLVGALCYAELASTYPRSGGDYVYLSRAYGSWAGFLFGWAQLAVIMTGSIGMMAYVFANYAGRVFGGSGTGPAFAYAAAAVVVITALNIFGAVFGKQTQNVLTGLKVVGLGGILVAGFCWPTQGDWSAPPATAAGGGSFGLAMILVLYTYGGWNDAAFVAAEQSNKRRNIPLALILGTAGIMVIYLLVNGAYLVGLGFEGARESRSIAADVLQRPLGDFGSRAMSVLVMISALGAVNGLTYTGARIYATLGEDHRVFGALGHWDARRGSPIASLVAQGGITLCLMGLVATDTGRSLFNQFLSVLGIGNVSWEGYGGFDTLLRCTAPVFWLFFLMTGVSLFLLRMKDRGIDRPFSVPWFPVVPLVFCGTSVYMLYSATTYAGKLALVGVSPIVIGVLLYLLFPKRNPNP